MFPLPILEVVLPTATHKPAPYATLHPTELKTVVPVRPVHVIPSVDVAIVFAPEPTATDTPLP